MHRDHAAELAELESRYLHLQRTVDDLNEVVIEQAKRLDQLERRVALLLGRMDALAERTAEPRSLEEEKPPHY